MESVVLTDRHVALAQWVGEHRFAWSQAHKCDPGLGPARTCKDASLHIRGCLCELGAAIVLPMRWDDNIGVLDKRDLEDLVEVRSARKWHHDLIINPTKRNKGRIPDWVPYVLALRADYSRRIWLPGWITMGEARGFPLKAEAHYDPAHFVPMKALYPIAQLREWLAAETAGRRAGSSL